MRERSTATALELAFALVIVLLLAVANRSVSESGPASQEVVVRPSASDAQTDGSQAPGGAGEQTNDPLVVRHLKDDRHMVDGRVLTTVEVLELIENSDRSRVVLQVPLGLAEVLRHAQEQYKKTTLAPVEAN